jgi:hypothetical protein
MSFEDVGAVKRSLMGSSQTGAEWAKHRALIVCERVAVLVILAGKPFEVILA